MWGQVQARLTSDASHWYKLWSSWLALVWGGIVFAVVEDPTTLSQVLSMIPAPYNHAVPPLAFAVAAALPIIVRCLKQSKLSSPATPPQ